MFESGWGDDLEVSSSGDDGDDTAPETDSSDTSGFSTSSSSSSSSERFYRGTPTRTQLIRADSHRVSKKRLRVEVPAKTKMKQASNGKVKAFVPRVFSGPCCKRGCSRHFQDAKNLQLIRARAPLYDTDISRPAMRELLLNNAIDLLRNPWDGAPVCGTMVNIAYTCSTSFLNPNFKRSKGTQGNANRRRAKLVYSVMAWFENEKELSDVMPDTGVYLFSYPRRHVVYERYVTDVAEITTCSSCAIGRDVRITGPCGCPEAKPVYLRVSETYFMQLWAQHFLNCQIRKHMRFSQCSICVKWRSIKNSRKNSLVVRTESKEFLSGHYKWIKRERAAEIAKVRLVSVRYATHTHTHFLSFCLFAKKPRNCTHTHTHTHTASINSATRPSCIRSSI
jgi:hypothetical protein